MKKWFGKKISEARKEIFFSQFQSLLEAGLSFSRSFDLLTEGETDERTCELYRNLYRTVVKGNPLWLAMKQSGEFTALDCGVVRIGEETGKLAYCLDFLRGYYEKRMAQERMVKGALSYPLIVILMALIVMIFMLMVIVPMFEQVYSRMGGELPAMTRWAVALSDSFPLYGGLACLLGMAFVTVYLLYGKSEGFQRRRAAFFLRIPRVGTLLRKNYEARICKLLYLLCGAGIPLLTGIEMLEEIILFYPYRVSFGKIAEGLRRGGTFAGELSAFPAIYEKRLVALLRVGEETNRLDRMLLKEADDLTKELEYQLKQLGNLLEPVLILSVGILVALILIAMYMPMFQLGNTIYR